MYSINKGVDFQMKMICAMLGGEEQCGEQQWNP